MHNQLLSGLIRSIMQRRYTIFAVLFALFAGLPSGLTGQEAETFKPGGKPEVRIFTSLSSSFSDGETRNKFDLTRAYFGYNYNFSQKLSGRVVFDVADPSAGKLKFTGMLKFGYLRYQTGKWTITGGMIPLPHYDIGDKRWGFRYVFKPFHDEYGFGGAADLGLSAVYRIAPWFSADVTLMNGEGYKLAEADSTFKAAAGITISPVKELSLRGYFDTMTKNGTDQQTVELIATFETGRFILSTAYNFQKNHNLTDGNDYHGYTFNGTVSISDRVKVFGRYDNVTSEKVGNSPEPWNIARDGQLILGGFDIILAPGVNLSPNYQGWKPADTGMPFVSRFMISLDLKI